MASFLRYAFWPVPDHPTLRTIVRRRTFVEPLEGREVWEPRIPRAQPAAEPSDALPLYDYMGCFTAGGEWRPSPAAAPRQVEFNTATGAVPTTACCPAAALPRYTPVLPTPTRQNGGAPPASGDGALRVVAISDTHEFHTQLRLPPGDILIHCGDILTIDRFTLRCVSEASLKAFFAWFGSQPFAVKVCIGGNHDAAMERLGHDAVKRMAADAGVVYLQHTMVDVCGAVRILGEPVSTGSTGNSAFQDRKTWPTELPRQVGRLALPSDPRPTAADSIGQFSVSSVDRSALPDPNRVDVHITHGCASSSTIAARVARVAPAVHLCGHIHSHHGARVVRGTSTVSINAASVDGKPTKEYLMPPIVLDFDPSSSAARPM